MLGLKLIHVSKRGSLRFLHNEGLIFQIYLSVKMFLDNRFFLSIPSYLLSNITRKSCYAISGEQKMDIYVFNSLSTSESVMGGCVTLPSHYLNQYWQISYFGGIHLRVKKKKYTQTNIFIIRMSFKITYFTLQMYSLRTNEQNTYFTASCNYCIHLPPRSGWPFTDLFKFAKVWPIKLDNWGNKSKWYFHYILIFTIYWFWNPVLHFLLIVVMFCNFLWQGQNAKFILYIKCCLRTNSCIILDCCHNVMVLFPY